MPLPTTLNDLVLLVTYNKLSAFSARQLFPIALYRKAAENGKKNFRFGISENSSDETMTVDIGRQRYIAQNTLSELTAYRLWADIILRAAADEFQ